jgi:hypothetical protein
VQVLDQKIAPAFARPDERAHLLESLGIDLAALRGLPWTAALLAGAFRSGPWRILNVHRHLLEYDLKRFQTADNPPGPMD